MSATSTALPALVGRTLVAFTRDTEAVDTRPAFRLPVWANYLRLLDDGPVPQRDLRAATCVSRRQVASMLAGLQRWGWATVEGPSRRKVAALTPTGRSVAGAWHPVPGRVEATWRSALGAERVDGLRAALAGLVGRLPLEHPHYPEPYGLADPTVAGGGGLDDHGADWRPVPRRGDAAAVAGLPLHALLSQALTAFALDYEAGGDDGFRTHGPFATAAFLQHVEDGTPVADTPFRPDLSPTTRYTLPRHGLGDVEADRAKGLVVRLTDRGRAWRDAYGPRVAAVTAAWRRTYGASCVDTLAAAVGAVAKDLPPGLPDHPLDA